MKYKENSNSSDNVNIRGGVYKRFSISDSDNEYTVI